MNEHTGRNDQISNPISGQRRDARTMTTQKTTINRRRWLRIMTAIMGVILLTLQAAPVLAGNQSLDDLSYRLGKEETGYSSPNSLPAPGSGTQLAFTPPTGEMTASNASGLTTEDRIDALKTAAEMLSGAAPPSGPVSEDPTDDAELAQAAEAELIVRDEFTNYGDSGLWTGEFEGNESFISEEDGGWYIMTVQPGVMLPIIATGNLEITDGAVIADARFAGGGAGDLGVIGRSAIDSSAYYYCMIDVYGGAGCFLKGPEGWSELFYRAPGDVTRYQMDRLLLDISNDTLTFAVNDEIVGTIEGAALTGGSWGLATSCYEGECSGSFDFIDVYAYGAATSDASTTVVGTGFNGDQAELFFTGEGDWGFANINDGWYAISLAQGYYFPNMIGSTEGIANGIITADIAYDGDGAFGLVARLSYNEDGAASYYVCWVNSSAFSNCHVVVDGSWYEIEGAAGAEVALEEINRLSLGVLGDQILFAVNGQIVADVRDTTLPAGAMGFYHETFGNASANFTTFVDAVMVESLDGGSASGALIGSDLNADNDLGLYTGSGDWGFADFVYDGLYTVEMAPGWYFPNPIADTSFIQSGAMTTVVDFGGDGSTGLIARYQESEHGSSFYVCWIDTDAYAGCHAVIDGDWYSLGSTGQPIMLDGPTELTLALNGPEITFLINGAVVVETVDDTLTNGDWGFYNDALDGGEGAWSDTDLVIIEEYAID